MASARTVEFVLPAEPQAAGRARWSVLDVLDGQVDRDTLTNVLLLTSELVTNAVVHGRIDGGEMRLYIALESSRVRVAISDPGPGFDPRSVKRPSYPLRGGGFGLLLLDKVADRWGTDSVPEHSVWFEIGP
jgi:anti-sigma regulatory factor (Ser/Thr protein kinase)